MCEIRAGRSPYNRADALGTTSPASTQALTTPSKWYYARNPAASASRLGSLFVFRFDKEGHNTVKLVRQRSPKQHPLESRQFF